MSESRSTNPWKPWQRLLDPIGPDYRRQLLKARNRATRAIDDLYKDELAMVVGSSSVSPRAEWSCAT